MVRETHSQCSGDPLLSNSSKLSVENSLQVCNCRIAIPPSSCLVLRLRFKHAVRVWLCQKLKEWWDTKLLVSCKPAGYSPCSITGNQTTQTAYRLHLHFRGCHLWQWASVLVRKVCHIDKFRKGLSNHEQPIICPEQWEAEQAVRTTSRGVTTPIYTLHYSHSELYKAHH